ncbi:hypothetical protein FLW53_14535 [Microbispora sp. SCL1-1]|uniref:hypothetical protein n=1 Tax=unclassified Microbispora TaxID=2614687 RepID=UPI001156F821|nr:MULTISPECIES: hypothetical protein [unclassified Microbispora]NJP25386.1 hypothetical protein [Microbispora sp. CL1-1]TQS13359.1 hypothetical protein FLW53_14535 [Microbispora sp. SCL1-1]
MISTLILAQGAAEGYVNWVFLQAGLTPNGTWIDRWSGLRNAARALGRDDRFGLPQEHRKFFNELNAWRNYLLHGDEKARKALHEALEAQGRTDLASEIDILDSAYATSVMTRVESAFRWAEQHSGVQAPFLNGAWVALDEI